MISGLRPYPAYKDSGVRWLGKVPEHWEVRRLGNLGLFSASGIDKNVVDGEPLVKMINYLDIYDNPARELDSDRNYQIVSCPVWKISVHSVKQGDLLFTPSSETHEEIGFSAVCIRDLPDTVYSYHTIRFRTTKKVETGFKKHWCNNRAVLDQFSASCKGTTRQILVRRDFRSVLVPLPTVNEQNDITRFLNHTDQRIQRYISTKQKLLSLLKEQKQAIIHQAVKGQINVRTGEPYPAYKPLGVGWLGDVPEHWEMRRLKTLSQIRYGLGQPPKESAYGLPLIRATNVSQGKIIDKDMVYVDPTDVPTGRNAFLAEGEIIVVRSGAYTADSAIIPSEYNGAVTGYDMVVTVNKALPEFIAFVLLDTYVHDDQLFVASMRSAQPHLNAEELGSALVLLPPSLEQTAIVEFLDKATADINTAITRTRRKIELLLEYRTRVVADVVTGKLDVREAAIRLSDEVEPIDKVVDSAESQGKEDSGVQVAS